MVASCNVVSKRQMKRRTEPCPWGMDQGSAPISIARRCTQQGPLGCRDSEVCDLVLLFCHQTRVRCFHQSSALCMTDKCRPKPLPPHHSHPCPRRHTRHANSQSQLMARGEMQRSPRRRTSPLPLCVPTVSQAGGSKIPPNACRVHGGGGRSSRNVLVMVGQEKARWKEERKEDLHLERGLRCSPQEGLCRRKKVGAPTCARKGRPQAGRYALRPEGRASRCVSHEPVRHTPTFRVQSVVPMYEDGHA